MDEQTNIGVIGKGKMGILHTGILSSLDGVEVGYHKQIMEDTN
jgi:hypothetical protein